MTALRNACSATDTLLDIDTALGIDAYPTAYTIESEVVNVIGGGRATSVTVARGIGGTTAATHVNGSTLTAANAFSGGGGLDVTDGTTTVAGATSVQVPTVIDAGEGIAVVQPTVISASDPGAIGAGNLWVREFPAGVTAGQDPTLQLFVRNPTDDGWLRVSIGDGITSSDSSIVRKWFLADGTEVTRISTTQAAVIGGETSGTLQLYTATVAQLTGSFDINANGAERQIRLLHYDAAGNADFTFVINDTGIKVTGLPTADPTVAGQLWIDTAAGRVIKVSAGA